MIGFRLDSFIDTKSLDKLAELYELINEKRLNVKDTGVNYRMINHWDKMGLIRFGRNKKEGNRKFSFVDFIWIKVVNELRNFGVELPVIKQITEDIYERLPMNELMDNFSNHLNILDNYEGEDKEEYKKFIESGEYKKVNYDELDIDFNYLQILLIEAIGAANLVSLIIFEDGEWFPYIKSQEHLYPRELIAKKEVRSQVRISLTDIVYKYIMEDAMLVYIKEFSLFSYKEAKLLSYLKEGDYKKLYILFKSKKREPLEIKKSKTALADVTDIIREKEYREFILTDKKNREFRIKDTDQSELVAALEEREKIFNDLDSVIKARKEKEKNKKREE